MNERMWSNININNIINIIIIINIVLVDLIQEEWSLVKQRMMIVRRNKHYEKGINEVTSF